jgi:hypothetical protein
MTNQTINFDIAKRYLETEQIKHRYFAKVSAPLNPTLQKLHVEEMRNLMSLVDASVPPVFNSNRKIWAKAIVWLKTFVISIFWPIVRIALRRQTQLNHFVWSLTFSSIQMQNEIDQLRSEVANLKAQLK